MLSRETALARNAHLITNSPRRLQPHCNVTPHQMLGRMVVMLQSVKNDRGACRYLVVKILVPSLRLEMEDVTRQKCVAKSLLKVPRSQQISSALFNSAIEFVLGHKWRCQQTNERFTKQTQSLLSSRPRPVSRCASHCRGSRFTMADAIIIPNGIQRKV